MEIVEDMSAEIRLSYIYVSDANWKKFEEVCDRVGWQSKALVQQIIHSFLAKHRDFYADAAAADAAARGMAESDYYREMEQGSEAEPTAYKSIRPDFGSTPLAVIPDPEATKETRRNYNRVTLGDYNFALFHAVKIIERTSNAELVSRIVAWHFSEYWERIYAPQINRDNEKRFK